MQILLKHSHMKGSNSQIVRFSYSSQKKKKQFLLFRCKLDYHSKC